MTCRLEPGVYYTDGNGSPLIITDVDYRSFSLPILTTIIRSLTDAYRSALAAKPYVQACHKLQTADRSSKDMGDLLSLRYGASEPDPLRNFLVKLSIRAFLGVGYCIPRKSLEGIDRSDHSRFVQFCEVTASKVPQTQRTRHVKRALGDIDKKYFSRLQQELNDASDTEGQTTTVLRSTGTKLITQAKNTSQNPRESRPSRSPLIHSAVPDPSEIPVDQPSSKRARIETISPSPSNSRDWGAQQNDQLDTTRSDGLRMQVDLEGMSTHGQELESVSRSSNSPEHSDDSQPSTIFDPAALTSQNMQSQHCASRESRQFNVPNSTTPAETTDQENQMIARDRTLMISDIIESNSSPGQTMPQLLSSMALTCTSEHDGAEGKKASPTILIPANQC
ncbi:hypothetical protein BKA61DRAFT_618556 [Leptodontidium sp. MPI-SDFR-AT-0119]|nr:hypothetical protein BKA61DRAFT_618556 [Leptodontidium sp. MPI-SDFR-AT-0119]